MRSVFRFLIPFGVLVVIVPAGFWPFLAADAGNGLGSPMAGILLALLAIGAAVYLRHIAALVISHFNDIVGIFAGLGARPIQGDILRDLAKWVFLGIYREKDWALFLEYSQAVIWVAAIALSVISLCPVAEKLVVIAGLLGPGDVGFAGPLAWHDLIWALPSASLLLVLAALPPCGRVAVRTDEQLVKLMLNVLERLTEWRMMLKNALVAFADSGLDESIDMLRNALLEWLTRRKKGSADRCNGED